MKGGQSELARVTAVAEMLIAELVECRSFIYMEARHLPTLNHLSSVINEARAAIGVDDD